MVRGYNCPGDRLPPSQANESAPTRVGFCAEPATYYTLIVCVSPASAGAFNRWSWFATNASTRLPSGLS
ncbi:MAG: hypothetical protein IPJ07_11085 [Acidobacteria bacterium]|nr:hypothetical protein [Acidobacteriota bacterium]